MDPAWLDAVVLLTTGGSSCTGTFVDREGTVLTAYHCVASGVRPTVQAHDGRTARGRLVAADPEHDLALLAVPDLEPKATLALAAADPPVGAHLWAIGHPYAAAAGGALEGTLLWSVTSGVVSAVGAQYVQTDAALNPGNSGGPLVDDSGALVAVVSRKLAADNLSFGSRVGYAAALLESRRAPPLLGGTWGLGLALTPTHARGYALAGEFGVVAKERVWVRLQIGGAWGDTSLPHVKAALGVRQRAGNGQFSTTFDLGGAWVLDAPVDPEVNLRVTTLGIGLGGVWAPVSGAWGLELVASLPWRGAW